MLLFITASAARLVCRRFLTGRDHAAIVILIGTAAAENVAAR